MEALAFDKLGHGPFCFFRLQQDHLADLALTRVEGPLGAEFDDVPLAELTKKIEAHAATDSAIKSAIEELKGARDAADLNGRERLCGLQKLLVELLSDLESKEGFLLRPGLDRSSCGG